MKNSGSGPIEQVSAMPVFFKYASALRATYRGSRLNSLPVTGSTTFAITLIVGLTKNGSIAAVAASGIASMSDSWMPIQPRIDEPSKPRPSVKVSASHRSMGKEQCCQLPSMSTNLRSTMSASCFLASLKKSSDAICRLPSVRPEA